MHYYSVPISRSTPLVSISERYGNKEPNVIDSLFQLVLI
jgi:hypothetical protein